MKDYTKVKLKKEEKDKSLKKEEYKEKERKRQSMNELEQEVGWNLISETNPMLMAAAAAFETLL